MVPSSITEIMENTSTNKINNTNSFHKLKHKWNLWAHLPQDPEWTIKSYKLVYKFNSVEETIAITESLPEVLIKNCMLYIMKDGINPMWEDSKNRNGGCFSYKVSNKNVYEVWRDLTYVLVGETISTNLPFVNSVTGITISPKKNFCIVKIWLSNCDHQNPLVVTNQVKYLIPQGCLFKKHTPEF
jgi:hypothetical protein